MKQLVLTFLITVSLAMSVTKSRAADIPLAAESCQNCHQLEVGANSDVTAPPLFYAGNKFNREWLQRWLQSPTRIRPAGDFYANHVETIDGVDTIAVDTLSAHSSVDSATAQELTDWLMSLKPLDNLITASGDYVPGSVSPRLGAMDFVKFKGCGGCHRDTPEYGGLSAPELYTAWQRLQPAFIVSYVKDPRAWDQHSAMPNRGLNDGQIFKLANYLKILAED
ncbi:MAG: hypothetical protein DHS20C12_09200 [Pseudohongiella sp.]|nr:MAG: hypothetical protein DHS20C12_09200 [Pseudohongiella sp.]